MRRKHLLHDIEKFRAKLRSASPEIQTQYNHTSEPVHRARLVQSWQVWVEELTKEGDRLNKRILDQNLRQPVAHLKILKIRLNEELERAGISRFFESV